MTVESVTYISDFDITLPTHASDNASEGDDHLRNIKKGSKNTFSGCTGAVTATHTHLNQLDGAAQNLAVAFKGRTAAGIATTGGTDTAYTLTTGLGLSTAGGGFTATVIIHATCGADPTMQVDSTPALNLVDKDGATFSVGDIPAGAVIRFVYDGTNLVVIGGLQTATTPTFSNYIVITEGTWTVPAGVSRIKITLLGSGGSGGPGGYTTYLGAGGGSGARLDAIIPVSPGQVLTTAIGQGGLAVSTGEDGNDGGDTYVEDTTNDIRYIAGGGQGGQYLTGGTGGTTSTSGTGTPQAYNTTNGSAGGNGSANPAFGAGGGAGAPGDTGAGNAGANGTSGASGAGGDGSGGAAGGASVGSGGGNAGTAGSASGKSFEGGGGGSGGVDNTGGAGANWGSGGGGSKYENLSGAGANGRIVIEY